MFVDYFNEFGFGIFLVALIIFFLMVRRAMAEWDRMRRKYETSSASQEDTNSIFNISSNVEDRPSQTLTSDAFVSIQHINTVNQMNNKSAQNDEPPSYEEAIKMSNNGQPPAFTSIIITAPSQDERNHPPSPVPIHSSTTH